MGAGCSTIKGTKRQVPQRSIVSNLNLSRRDKLKGKAPVVDSRKESSIILEIPCARVVQKAKSPGDKLLIMEGLLNHFILKNLDEYSQLQIAEAMTLYEVMRKETVFEEGQPGLNFFIVAKGILEVTVGEKSLGVIKRGTGFGELALLDDSPRTATVRTIEHTYLWGLDRNTFRKAVRHINSLNYLENRQFLDSVPFFENLTAQQKDNLLDAMNYQNWSNNQKIVKEGDTGNLFYIVKEGTVMCSRQGEFLRNMTKGMTFGEQSLLYDIKRTATITAVGDVKVLSIDRDSLIQVLGDNLQDIIYRNSETIAFEKSPVLKLLSLEQSERIFNCLKVVKYEPGQVVVPRNCELRSKIWVVLKGSIKGPRGEVCRFDTIGDYSVAYSEAGVYEADYLANTECDLAEITQSEFLKCLGGNFKEATAYNEALGILKQVILLKGLSNERFQALLRVLKLKKFECGEVILRENQEGSSFYIIKSGKVEVSKNGEVLRIITKHDYFGERAVLFNDFRSATVEAREPVSCWVLEKEDFNCIIDEDIRQKLIERVKLQDICILLEELIFVKSLGKGMFGNVLLAVHTFKDMMFAVKSVPKKKVESYKLARYLELERSIMLQLDHPMIVKLVKTFEDQQRFYFLMEFVEGMDLFDVLRKLGLLKDQKAKFYTACLVLILEHLHERNIIYRDLKPENIMIDKSGYPKLIDFGTAKEIQGRTYTTLGTPHYMAPEVILGSGYGLQADWWSLGVMLYEFVYGGVPFGDNEEEPYQIYEKVLQRELEFPSFGKPEMKSLVTQLLSKTPSARTGGSIDKVKSHKWFQDFAWSRLFSGQVQAPFIPRQISRLDEAKIKAFGRMMKVPDALNNIEVNDFFALEQESLNLLNF